MWRHIWYPNLASERTFSKRLIVVFCIEFYDFEWKPHLNRMKWRRDTANWRNSNFTWHIWSNLRGFKHENNECICNGEMVKLHKVKIVVFWLSICGAMTGISSRFTSFLRHNDVTRDEIRVIASYMLSQKTAILILCSFVFSPKLMHLLLSLLKPLNFDHIWSCGHVT